MTHRRQQYAGLALLLALSASAGRATPEPPWWVPEASHRAVIRESEAPARGAWVRLPPAVLPHLPIVAARDARGNAVRFATLHTNAVSVSVLLAPTDDVAFPLALYCGAPADFPVESAPEWTDPTPVLATAYRAPGKGVPATADRLHYLLQQSRRREQALPLADFGPVDAHGDRRTIVHFRTHLRCPQAGIHRFAVESDSVAFLYLDGVAAATRAERAGRAGSDLGPPLYLEPGVHAMDLYVFTEGAAHARLRWSAPNAEAYGQSDDPTAPPPLPRDLLLPALRLDAVLESADQPLLADLALTPQRAYFFRGYTPVFRPVTMTDRSRSRTGAPWSRMWSVDGRDAGGAETLTRVLADTPHGAVRLELQDRLGFRASHTRFLEPDLRTPAVHMLTAIPRLMPAVAFPDDVVMPDLQVAADLPPNESLDLFWRVYGADGDVLDHRTTLRPPRGGWSHAELAHQPAGTLDRIEWRIEHHGVALPSGVIQFQRAPLDAMTLQAVGDRLVDPSGAVVVLVVDHHAPADPSRMPLAARPPRRVLVVDDGWTAPGEGAWERTLAERLGLTAMRVPVSVPTVGPEAEHLDALRLFTDLAPRIRAEEADVVVLGLALDAWTRGEEPAHFERRLAALADLLGAGNGRMRLVWMTPPPFGLQTEAVRPYAAAVRRVARVRGIPVADLFSRIAAAERPATLLQAPDALTLSPTGREAAAACVAYALAQVAEAPGP